MKKCKYKFQDGGEFSDDFYSALSNFEEQDEEQVDTEEVDEEDNYNYNDDEEQDESNYYDQILKDDEEEEDNRYNENGSLDAVNMVESQYGQSQTQDLSWIPKKTSQVNLTGTSSKLAQYLNGLPPQVKAKLLATSGNDNHEFHVKNSKHKSDKAVDFRYNKDVYNYLLGDPNFKKSGLKVLDPNHGNAPHIHIEE